jgi:hypothetical protein
MKELIESLFEMGMNMAQPYQYRIGKCNKLACFYYFNIEDDDKYSVRFINLGEILNNKKQIWQTEFVIPGGEYDKKIISKEKSYKVIYTVIAIIKDFITDHDVEGLNISPALNYSEDERRYNLCIRYIDKLLPEFPHWKKNWTPFTKTIVLRKKKRAKFVKCL